VSVLWSPSIFWIGFAELWNAKMSRTSEFNFVSVNFGTYFIIMYSEGVLKFSTDGHLIFNNYYPGTTNFQIISVDGSDIDAYCLKLIFNSTKLYCYTT